MNTTKREISNALIPAQVTAALSTVADGEFDIKEAPAIGDNWFQFTATDADGNVYEVARLKDGTIAVNCPAMRCKLTQKELDARILEGFGTIVLSPEQAGITLKRR